MNYLPLGWQFKTSFQWPRGEIERVAHAHNWARQRSTDPEDFAVVPFALYQNHCGPLEGGRRTDWVRTVSAILSCGGKLSGPSGLRPLCRGTLLVAMRKTLRTDRISRFKVQRFSLFRNLMEKEMKNKPHYEKLNTKPNNRQPPNIGKARGSVQRIHPQRPPSKTLHDYPPVRLVNAWNRPLNLATTQIPQPHPQLYSLIQPRDLPSRYTFVSRAEVPQLH
jgi:hypothetical protein